MKKLLGLLLVLTLTWPVASAEVLKDVSLIGEIETIASDVNHNTKVGPADYYNQNVNTRVLAGLSAELVEDVRANVLFQYVTNWDGAMEGDRVSDYENNVYLSNANVVLSNLFDCFEATIGRQFYGDEDSAVMYIGPNHYNAEHFGRAPSLDAAKLTYSDDAKSLTLIAGKVDRGLNALGHNQNGTTVLGADFRLNLTDALGLQAYIYDFRNITVLNPDGEEDSNAGLYGAKVTFNPEAFKVSAEYARNFGGDRFIREHEETGYMAKADVSMSVEELTVRGTFLYAHENFFSYGAYTPGLLIGHRLDIYEYTANEGVRLFNAGVDVNPFEKWTFSLDGYAFQDRYGHGNATWEADLTAKYTHNEYVQLFAGLGYARYASSDRNADIGVYRDVFNKDNYKWQLGMLINF